MQDIQDTAGQDARDNLRRHVRATLHRCLKQIPRLRFASLGMTPCRTLGMTLGKVFEMTPGRILRMTCGRIGIALTTASTVAPARGCISVRASSTLCRRPKRTIVTLRHRHQPYNSRIETAKPPPGARYIFSDDFEVTFFVEMV